MHALCHDLRGSDFLEGGGVMGASMRGCDWAATALGAPETWPQTLRIFLRTLLASRQPMWLWWGPEELVQFYNDALIPLLGNRHPAAWALPRRSPGVTAGARSRRAPPRPPRASPAISKPSRWSMGRGVPEESYYTFSLTPVIEAGRRDAGGVIGIVTDETDQVRSSRLLALEIEHRRRIERHQNLLLDELNHRVKNSLATVQAMAMQTLKGVDAPARDTFLARLFALSGQHDLLTMDNWEGASLEGVIRRALRPWREDERLALHDRRSGGASGHQARTGAGHGLSRTGDQCGQLWCAVE